MQTITKASINTFTRSYRHTFTQIISETINI